MTARLSFLPASAARKLADAGARLSGSRRAVTTQQITDFAADGLRPMVAGEISLNGTYSLPAGAVIFGLPGAEIVQTAAPANGSGRTYTFTLASDVVLADIALNMESPVSGTSGFYLLDAAGAIEDIRIERVTADYDQTINSTTGEPNALGGVLAFKNTTTLDRLTISHSRFRRFFWGFLKGNSDTSTDRNISISFSEFSDFGSTALLFNSPHPAGRIENVLVLGNTLGANNSRYQWDSNLPGFGHRATFAGNVRFGRFIANHAEGAGDHMVRAEEGADGIVWALNTGEFEGYNASEIVPNDAGGTMKTPQRFLIVGNVWSHKGTPAGHPKGPGTGIKLHAKGGDPQTYRDAALHNSVICHNVLSGFAEGIRTTWGTETLLVQNNILADCSKGLQIYQPTLGVQDNIVSGASTAGVHFEHGGLIGPVHFRPASDTPGPFEAVVTRARARAGLTEWTWETGYYDLAEVGANSITSVPIIRCGAMMDGELIVSLSQRDVFLYSVVIGTAAWNGSAFTWTLRQRKTNGSLVVSSTSFERDNNGKLAVRLFSAFASAYPGIMLQVAFRGLHVFD